MNSYVSILHFYNKLGENSEEFSTFYPVESARKILKDLKKLNISGKLLADVEAKIASDVLNDTMFDDILKEVLFPRNIV